MWGKINFGSELFLVFVIKIILLTNEIIFCQITPNCINENAPTELCYYYDDSKNLSWQEASEYCNETNSKLPTIRQIIEIKKFGEFQMERQVWSNKTPMPRDGKEPYCRTKDVKKEATTDDNFNKTDCSLKLLVLCIGKINDTKTNNSKDKTDEIQTLQTMDIEEEAFKNWNLSCDVISLKVENIERSVENVVNFRISELVDWSLIKYLKSYFHVTCKINAITSTFRVHPVHSYEFSIKSNDSQNNHLTRRKISNEFLDLYTDLGKNVKNEVRYDEARKTWNIILMSSDENVLQKDIRKILENNKYIPQFCPEESFEYGAGNYITWNFTQGNKYQTSFPDICWIENKEMIWRQCLMLESQGFRTFKWTPFDISHCSSLGRCPLGYETVGNSKCMKFIEADSFEDYFYDLKGIEENILDVLKQNNSAFILNYIRSKGKNEVLIPIKKLNDFDATIFISNSMVGGYSLIDEENFDENMSISDQYFTYDIVSSSNKSYLYLKKNITHISVIDTENMIDHRNSSAYSQTNRSSKWDLCPENTLYYSNYNDKCLILFDLEISLNFKDAKKFCQNRSYNLLHAENEFMASLYNQILIKENIPIVWINVTTNKTLNLLTPFGRYSLKTGSLIKNIICEVKSNATTSLDDLRIQLSQSSNKRNLCLNFSKNKISFLRNFPTCYCYPHWNEPQKAKIGVIKDCDYEVPMRYSSFCQCTAVVLHFQKSSILHSNKFEYRNNSNNYFVLHILITINNTFFLEINIGYILRRISDAVIFVSCQSSVFHTYYNNISDPHSKSYALYLSCPESTNLDQIENLANDVTILNINKLKNLTINVLPADGCPENVIILDKINLTWTSTEGKEGVFEPTEKCLTQSGSKAFRKCEGNQIIGFTWKPFVKECNSPYRNIDKDIDTFVNANDSNKIDKLNNFLLKNEDVLPAYIINTVADIFSKSKMDEIYSVTETVNVVETILQSSITNITEINLETNSSNKLLSSFDNLLLRNNSFLSFSNQTKQNRSILTVFAGKIQKDIENKFNEINIISTGNDLSLSFHENSVKKQPEVKISIPKSLLSSDKEIGFLYKQWQSHLLFDDSSLNKSNKLVGDVIDITFVDLKTQRSIKNLQDNISIKIKQDWHKSKNYSCVSWNLKEGHWTTDGCTTVLSEDDDHHITCVCNHLTHYGLLFGENEEKPVLIVLVYIGSSISIIALTIIIASAVWFKHWPKNDDCESKSLVNLCVAILGATFALIIGANQVGNYVLCRAFAFILHYFLLSSFCWMSVEAVYKHLTYVKHKSYYLDSKLYNRSFYFSWGIPLVVTLPVGVFRFFMSNEPNIQKSCWLLGSEMYYGFLVPLIIFMTFNLIIYFKIIYSLCTILRYGNLKNSESSKKRHFRVIFEIISLSFLFGLSWFFGLFILTEKSSFKDIIIYIFNILQSLHGFLIVFRIFNNKALRKEWRHYIKELQGGNPKTEEFVTNLKKSNQLETGITK